MKSSTDKSAVEVFVGFESKGEREKNILMNGWMNGFVQSLNSATDFLMSIKSFFEVPKALDSLVIAFRKSRACCLFFPQM